MKEEKIRKYFLGELDKIEAERFEEECSLDENLSSEARLGESEHRDDNLKVFDFRLDAEDEARLEEAFERIEETILPCIAMMLETLLDASETAAQTDPKALAAELQILAAELEELTRAVERSSPVHLEPGEYKTAAA